jgi:hypothetical protein
MGENVRKLNRRENYVGRKRRVLDMKVMQVAIKTIT